MALSFILGHRGAILPGGHPFQNSRGAFQLALTHADGFETDACVSRDGEVFLIHDEGDRLASYLSPESAVFVGNRRIDDLTSADVRTLRLRDGSPVPTLAEALSLCQSSPGKIINIELKGYNVLPAVRHTLATGPTLLPAQILFSSFDHTALLDARRQIPSFRIGALFVAPDDPLTPMHPWQSDSKGVYTPLTSAALSAPLLQQLQPEFIVAPDSALCETTFDLLRAHLPNTRLVVWETGEGSALAPRVARFEQEPRLAGLIVNDPRRE